MTLERVKRGLPLLLGDALTLLCLLAGGLGCVLPLNRFDIGGGLLLAVCALLSIGSAALHTWRYGSWTSLGLLGIEALAVWRNWEALAFAQWLQGAELQNRFIEFFLLAFTFALLLGWVVVRARCWYLAALVVTVPVLPAIVEGILPDWMSLTAAALGWGTMLLTALYDHRDRASFGKGVLLSMAGLAVLLLGLTAALPQEGYDRPQWATNARDRVIDTISKSFSSTWDWDVPEFLEEYLRIEGGGSGAGASGSGYRIPSFAVTYHEDGAYVDLRTAGPRRYTDNTVMEIQGGESGWNYLWGGSAAVYTGENWEDVDSDACYILRDMMNEQLELGGSAEPALFPAMTALGTAERIMTIHHTYPGGTTAYYPYRPMYYLTGGVELRSVLTMGMEIPGETRAVKGREVQEYQAAYRPGGPFDEYSPLSGDAAVAESIYRAFVYANYLDVPQAARDALSPLLGRIDASDLSDISDVPEQWREAAAAAQGTASALNAVAVYDLNTPAMEDGEDFVAQFLNRGRGYCIHFATAGALLLRMQGIPARYASGYAFHVNDRGTTEVKDSSAHAWVEVYLSGYGWYPVEMTPGFSNGEAAPDSDDSYLQAEDSDRFAPDERERPERPDEPDTPDDEPEEDAPSTAPEQENQTPGTGTPGGKAPLDLSWLRPLLKVLLAVSVPFALYGFGGYLRRRSRERTDTNGSVINAYVRYRRILAWGGEEVPVLEELARKARFSQHTLTAEEREAAWKSLEDAGKRLAIILPWWKKPAFWCLRPLF